MSTLTAVPFITTISLCAATFLASCAAFDNTSETVPAAVVGTIATSDSATPSQTMFLDRPTPPETSGDYGCLEIAPDAYRMMCMVSEGLTVKVG